MAKFQHICWLQFSKVYLIIVFTSTLITVNPKKMSFLKTSHCTHHLITEVLDDENMKLIITRLKICLVVMHQLLLTNSRIRFDIVFESILSILAKSLPRSSAISFLSKPYRTKSLKKSISAPVNLFLYLGQELLHCGRGHESIR